MYVIYVVIVRLYISKRFVFRKKIVRGLEKKKLWCPPEMGRRDRDRCIVAVLKAGEELKERRSFDFRKMQSPRNV